jgi:Predicted membrane protein
VSLFLSTALILGTGCAAQQKDVYDKDGNPVTVQQDNGGSSFFSGILSPFGPFGPFGFFSGRSSGVAAARSSVYQSGVSNNIQNSGDINSNTTKSNTGVTGVSPWGRNGSTGTSSGSSSKSGNGITSGSHGGIGGGGSSAS